MPTDVKKQGLPKASANRPNIGSTRNYSCFGTRVTIHRAGCGITAYHVYSILQLWDVLHLNLELKTEKGCCY